MPNYTRSDLFSNVSDNASSNLRFNCKGFKLSKFLTPVQTLPILSNMFFVILCTNTTVTGANKATLFVMDINREVVATYSINLKYTLTLQDFQDDSITHFVNQVYSTNTPSDLAIKHNSIIKGAYKESYKESYTSKEVNALPTVIHNDFKSYKGSSKVSSSALNSQPSFFKRIFNIG